MPIDAIAALAAGAIDFSSTTPDNFASLFKADTVYRIASDALGQDSAVIGLGPPKELLVNHDGVQDPRGNSVKYSNGHIIQAAPKGDTDSGIGTLYANADAPRKEVFVGLDEQPFDFLSGPPGAPFILIQEKTSGLVWEATKITGSEYPAAVTLRPKDGSSEQLWAFIQVP